MMKKYLLYIILGTLLMSCQIKQKTYQLPHIPEEIKQPSERAQYLAKHYWDLYNLSSIDSIANHDTEKAWVNYCYVLNKIPLAEGRVLVKEFFDTKNMSQKNYLYLVGLAEKYLYYQDSPTHNEELYISTLESVVNNPSLKEIEKVRYKYLLENAKRNRVGTKAINFQYTTESSKTGDLYGIKAKYTLLFFNNPGCQECQRLTLSIKSSTIINDLKSQNELIILAFHPDNDIEEWKMHLREFPSQWIVGYDAKQTLLRNEVYDLSFIPTLYLLDENKEVILKNVSLNEIEQWLNAHSK